MRQTFVLAITLLLTACTFNSELVRQINAKFPPVDPAANQLAAIKGATADLSGINPNAYVAVVARDIQRAIPQQISVALPDGTKVDARSVSVMLGEQEVIVHVPFANVQLDADRTRIGGEVEAHCSAAVDKNALVLRPSVSRIVIRTLRVRGTKVPDVIASLATAVLQPFLNNINGAIAAVHIPIDLHQIERVDLAALINQSVVPPIREVRDVSGSTLTIDAGLGHAAVLIEPQALRVLAEAVALTPERVAAIVNPQVASPQGVTTFATRGTTSSADLAVLSECGPTAEYLPPQNRAALDARCKAAAPMATMLVTAAAAPTPGGDVSAAFTVFRDAFKQRAATVDRVENLFWDRTAVAITRQPLVDALNETLLTAHAAGSFVMDSQSADIPESDRTLRLDKAPDLKCDDVGGSCPSVFDYPPYQPRGCPSDCVIWKDIYVFGQKVGSVPTIDLACQAWKPACEALKESERIGYEAAKTAALAAWSASKLACEAVKAGKQAGCRLNQGWLNDWSEADVGEIRGNFTAHDPFLRLSITNPNTGIDFASFGISADVSGGTDVQGSFTFVPHGAGHLLCVAQWSGDIHARANIPPQTKTLTLTRTAIAARSDGLHLTYAMPEIPVHVQFDPPPVKALIEQNPAKLAINCPVPLIILSQLAQFTPVNIILAIKLRDTIMNDSRDVKIPGRDVSFTIPRRTLDVALPNTKPLSIPLAPHWQEKAIVFAEE